MSETTKCADDCMYCLGEVCWTHGAGECTCDAPARHKPAARPGGEGTPETKYWCRSCSETFTDADSAIAHHDATGHFCTHRRPGSRPAAVSAPAPDRQKAAQCSDCGVTCFVDVGGALCDYRTMRFHACAVQDDIAAILRALGLSDHARPVSAHAVVRDEILPAIAALRQGSHA